MGAVKAAHRSHFDDAIRSTFADSLELDEAMKAGREEENRWDYLLGHAPSGKVVAVEPHSAKRDQIRAVIKKLLAATEQLREHLRDDARIAKWLWVASGKIHFADTEKVRRLLDQNGIEFVGPKVTSKHLPPAATTGLPGARKSSRRRAR